MTKRNKRHLYYVKSERSMLESESTWHAAFPRATTDMYTSLENSLLLVEINMLIIDEHPFEIIRRTVTEVQYKIITE